LMCLQQQQYVNLDIKVINFERIFPCLFRSLQIILVHIIVHYRVRKVQSNLCNAFHHLIINTHAWQNLCARSKMLNCELKLKIIPEKSMGSGGSEGI